MSFSLQDVINESCCTNSWARHMPPTLYACTMKRRKIPPCRRKYLGAAIIARLNGYGPMRCALLLRCFLSTFLLVFLFCFHIVLRFGGHSVFLSLTLRVLAHSCNLSEACKAVPKHGHGKVLSEERAVPPETQYCTMAAERCAEWPAAACVAGMQEDVRRRGRDTRSRICPPRCRRHHRSPLPLPRASKTTVTTVT